METKPAQTVFRQQAEQRVIHHLLYGWRAPCRVRHCVNDRAEDFFQPKNFLNLITNNWYTIILGIRVTFLLVSGNFDMSVGGVIALTGVLSVYFTQASNVSQPDSTLPYGVVVLALLCMSVGRQAFFVARLKVPSIIVTLATMMLARNIAQVVTKALSATPACRRIRRDRQLEHPGEHQHQVRRC